MGDRMEVEVEGGAPAAAPAAEEMSPDHFLIDLRKHERILREVFVVISPDVVEPGFFEGATDLEALVDMLCVCQLSSFADDVYPKLGGDVSLFAYCVDSYHRARACFRLAIGEERKSLLATLDKFLVRYALVALQQKGLFETIDRDSTKLIIEQVAKGGDHKGLGDNFFTELLVQFGNSDPGELETTFSGVLLELQQLAAAEVYRGVPAPMKYIDAIVELVRHKPLRSVVVGMPKWKPLCLTGAAIQMETWLGPLLSSSHCPGRFSNPDKGRFKDVEQPILTPDVRASFEQIRLESVRYQKSMHAIVLSLLSSKDCKSRVLVWIEAAIRLNLDRRKMHNQMQDEIVETTADDGFMMNLCAVMLGLCEKYANPTDKAKWPPSFEKINSRYLKHPASRIDVSKDTLLGEAKAPEHHLLDSLPPSHGDTRGGPAKVAHEDSAEAAPTPDDAPNFVTESFFLTLRALHVGLLPAVERYKIQFLQERSEFHHLSRRVQNLEKELSERGALSPFDQMTLTRWKERLGVLTRRFFSLMAHLDHEDYLSRVLNFYAFVCAWLLSLVDPEERGLPLSPDVPRAFANQPEHIVNDIADFMSFAAHVAPQAIEALPKTRLATIARFFTTFIGDQTYIRNPYILSKFVGVMAEFTPEAREKRHRRGASEYSFFWRVALSESTSVRHLAPALMRFFVNMEETDVYEQGNKRRQVGQIMQTLWKSDAHRAALVKDSNGPEFTRFIMLLINDTVDLFDSGREYLGKHLDAVTQAQHPDFESRPEQEKEEITQQVQQMENTARYFFDFAMEMMHIFTYLTTEIIEPVLEPELVQRLGYLLNFNLVDMIERGTSKEKCMEYVKVGLEPAELILKLVTVYLQVSGAVSKTPAVNLNTAFLEAIARDGRSFRPGIFRNAPTVVRMKYGGKEEAKMRAFVDLVSHFETIAEEDEALDADLGDIPDDFADPIMATLMLDPVRLPSSGQIMDRTHIRAHLLSNPRDPFNRAPLRIEDVVPEDDLREKIQAWVKERRAAAATTAGGAAAPAAAPMKET